MRRFLLIAAVLGLAVALLAQSSAPSDSKPPEDPAPDLCTVMGRVVAAADGNPLKSARVALIPEHNRSHHEEIYSTFATFQRVPTIFSLFKERRGAWYTSRGPDRRSKLAPTISTALLFHSGAASRFRAGSRLTGPAQ